MEFFSNLIKYLVEFKGYNFFGVDLWRLGIAILFFALVMLIRRVFRRYVIDRLHKLMSKSNTDIDDHIIDALKPCIQSLFCLVGLWVSFYIIGIKSLYSLVNHVGRTALIFIIAWALYISLDVLVVYYHKKVASKVGKKFHNYLVVLAGKIFKVLVVFGAAIAIFQEWGYNATTILAGLGIGGLAIALASKDFVANIFGFITLLLDRSLSVGDMIVTPELEGWVEDIGFRSTKVRTKMHTLITVPNSVIASGQINNVTKLHKRCINFTLNVACTSTIKQLEEFCSKAEKMLIDHPDVNNKDIHVYFTAFGQWSYDIFFYFFSNPLGWLEHLKVTHDINLKIMKLLEEVGMATAYPTNSIYMENLDAQTGKILKKFKVPEKVLKNKD